MHGDKPIQENMLSLSQYTVARHYQEHWNATIQSRGIQRFRQGATYGVRLIAQVVLSVDEHFLYSSASYISRLISILAVDANFFSQERKFARS